MKNFRQPLLIMIFLSLVCCSKDEAGIDIPKPPETKSNAKELTSLSILASNNSVLNIDADVQQNGVDMKIFFPANTERASLITTFQVSSKAKLRIGAAELSSGSSTLDFTQPFVLTVEAEDGSTKDYNLNPESNFVTLDSAIEALRTEYNVPGFQVVITRNDKLVYANSYGFADLNETENVTDASVFRLAGVSKYITAAAIMKLVESGYLTLDDTVFGVDGILELDFGSVPYGPNIEDITVRHLIEDTSGWTLTFGDPMFENLDFTIKEVIDDVLNNRPLETVPGTTQAGNNIGYAILGRIVEKVSGQSYANYVRQNLFTPALITRVDLGNNSLVEKLPNEVEYLSQNAGLGPYELNIERADSSFGWTANATDFAKFMATIDRNPGIPDLIAPEILNQMYFSANWGGPGFTSGITATVQRYNDEFSFVILANTSSENFLDLAEDMTITMTNNLQNRTSWPNYDLF